MASIVKKKKVAILGCGKISHFHIETIKSFKLFDITHICAKKNSKRCEDVGKRFKIPNIIKDPNNFFEETKSVDVIIILTSYDVTLKYLKKAVLTGKKIFVEKPVSLNLKKLSNFRFKKNVFVGFNRRYYNNIGVLKYKIQKEDRLSVVLEIPEKTLNKNSFFSYNKFYSNTIHVIDLIIYIFGDVKIKHVNYIKNKKKKIVGLYAIMKAKKAEINFIANWNSPANWSIKVDNLRGRRYLVEPIENLKIYEGIKVLFKKKKIRNFIPNIVSNEQIPWYEKKFKPGFYKQYEDFKNFCLNKKNRAPTLNETYKSQKVLQSILKLKK